ncbi:sporulation and cell division repeat protein [Bacteroidales bacterium KA00251]|nr:sporulation and cell division repeat protein [Bacteroidales bacterium KA00251]
MKKSLLVFISLTLLLGAVACKPKQSHYRQVYESAKQREIAESNASSTSSDVIVSKPAEPVISVRKERLNPVEGEDGMRLKKYSVVIGSFQNSTNAYSLKERMEADGYTPILARNESGMLRVIVTSFDSREAAAQSRDAIKQRYAPNFQDAWLLERDR